MDTGRPQDQDPTVVRTGSMPPANAGVIQQVASAGQPVGNPMMGSVEDIRKNLARFSGDYQASQALTDATGKQMMDALTGYEPDPSEKWLSFASTIARPTQFGTLGEVVGNVASGLQPIIGKEAALKQQYKMLAMQMGYQAQQHKTDQLLSATLQTQTALGAGQRGLMNLSMTGINAIKRTMGTMYTQGLANNMKAAEAAVGADVNAQKKWARERTDEEVLHWATQLPDEDRAIALPHLSALSSGLVAPDGDAVGAATSAGSTKAPGEKGTEFLFNGKTREQVLGELSQIPDPAERQKAINSFLASQPKATPFDVPVGEAKAVASGQKVSAEMLPKVNTSNLEATGKAIDLSYEKLKDAPVTAENRNQMYRAYAKSPQTFGAGAGTVNDVKSFIKNRLGFDITPEMVANPQEFAAAAQHLIGPAVKATDAQPAQVLITAIAKSMGSIENDPDAIPSILANANKLNDMLIDNHNERVRAAEKAGMQFGENKIIPKVPYIVDHGMGTIQTKKGPKQVPIVVYSDGRKVPLEQ